VALLSRWKNWQQARTLARRARLREWPLASALERARAQRLYRRALRLVERDQLPRAVAPFEAAPSPSQAEVRALALRVTRLRAAPPLVEFQLWAERNRRRAVAIVTATLLVCGALVAWKFRVQLGLVKNLAWGSTWRTSSAYPGTASSGVLTSSKAAFLFHTNEEASPSVSIDLGSSRKFSQLRIENRRDCCQMRALPLLVEASDDNVSWRPLLRREAPFQLLPASFPTTKARFVRLSVGRKSILHLADLRIYR
jgi:hypothetical protein